MKYLNNTARTHLIISIGSFNNYQSTEYQTKRALDSMSTKSLRQNPDDIAIFNDSLKGIDAIKKVGFSVGGIIAINTSFDSPSDEQPKLPGHLRNGNYNMDDRTAILVSDNNSDAYFPPNIVTKSDLKIIVDKFNSSSKSERDAWRVFAEVAKLQPFQDGNKRTALIAANSAFGALSSGDYLILPTNDLDRAEFTLMLMRFYSAQDNKTEDVAFERMLNVLPNESDRLQELSRPITKENPNKLATRKIKYEFREKKEGPDI
ncbi:Fic family protein [Companilactobacillus ginsenosidimutans]|uniref:Fido domain-containing protein n=1 Tax=Companilactobacillus ginsenosidimutans TaxID=1007676 RepID=A0A0H4R164_9LACO|nr:Fic family protein [Companilactobacillus ginsenosidimutans]AKP67440.1 hypothetical protein ABM34_07765 [Companilactobacillus ginsenosidimutans]